MKRKENKKLNEFILWYKTLSQLNLQIVNCLLISKLTDDELLEIKTTYMTKLESLTE